MASWSSMSTRTSGYRVLAADWNAIINNVNYLGSGTASVGRPAVMATSTATTSLTQDAWVGPIAFAGTDEYDTATMHDAATNNSRLTVPSDGAGLYQITAELYADAHSQAEPIHLMLRKNAAGSSTGGTRLAITTGTFSTNSFFLTGASLTYVVRLAASDYVELFVMSEAAGPELLAGTTQAHRFGMYWITA
jgi:hypothetical protein